MDRNSLFGTGLKLLAGVAACSLLVGTAHAGGTITTSNCACPTTIQFVDIRGMVTVNGAPAAGVTISVLCCDCGTSLSCSNAHSVSTATYSDSEFGVPVNYHVAFNDTPAGGSCMAGCSSGLLWFGCYTPWNVELQFSYNGCTTNISCDEVYEAYLHSSGQAEICVNIQCPTCPPCVDPALGLGAASSSTVLELGPSQVSINGPAGGIVGNIYIAPKGKANFSGGGQYLLGSVYLGAGASYQNSGIPVSGSILNNQNLTTQINAAYAAYNTDIALPATQTYTSGPTINVTSGLNVVDVPGDLHPNGNTVTINGPTGAMVIIRVHGLLKLDGGGKILVAGGVQPTDVIYVVVGTGQDVGATGGGGGLNCCNAVYDGTILAPYRKISLSPGLVNGEIISGLDISLVSGSGVHCPVCTGAPPN